MNILIVAPSSDLNVAPEIARVASGNSPVILDQYVSRARLATTLQTRQFEVVHFASHGSYDVLELSDGPVAVAEVANMLSGQCALKLIVLNACNSAGTAAILHDELYVPVVMYQAKANDGPAIRYAEALYDALGRGVGLREAHDRARDSIRKIFNIAESELPVLMNGSMTATDKRLDGIESRISKLEASMSELLRRNRSRLDLQTALIALLLIAILVDVIRHWPM